MKDKGKRDLCLETFNEIQPFSLHQNQNNGQKICSELLNTKSCPWLESVSLEQLFLHFLCSDSSLSRAGAAQAAPVEAPQQSHAPLGRKKETCTDAGGFDLQAWKKSLD